jgi:hypothetical protein
MSFQMRITDSYHISFEHWEIRLIGIIVSLSLERAAQLSSRNLKFSKPGFLESNMRQVTTLSDKLI